MVRLRHTVICLGQLLQQNKTELLSATLKARVDVALGFLAHRESNETKLILTGGDVAGVGTTEARAMFDYILSKPTSPSRTQFDGRLVLEEEAKNTVDNALFCKTILERNDWLSDSNLTVVTSDYHTPRARLVFRAVFGPSAEICCSASPGPAAREEMLDCLRKEILHLPALPQYLHDKYRYNITSVPSPREVDLALQELEKMLMATEAEIAISSNARGG